MLCAVGFLVFMLGATMVESATILIPITVVLIGAAMMYAGREDQDDDR